jgi:hypothetical protein
MAVNQTKTVSQYTLNNNMSGNMANDLYRATHGGSLGGDYVTGRQSSGNYTTANKKGNVTYHLAGGVEDRSHNWNGDYYDPNGGGSGLKDNITGSSQSTIGIGGNGGGSGYGYSEGGYASGGGTDYASMIAELIAQQRAAAEQAYGNSMKRLDEAWGANQEALSKNLDSTLGRLKNQFGYSREQVDSDAAKSLREAYTNYMLNKKNLAQGLAAMGVSGGATESNMARMYNNYGSARNNINTTAAENLAKLLNEYQGNVSSANQLYNSQYADAMNQRTAQLNNLENALASALTNLYTGNNLSQYANYASTLANLASPSFSSGSYSSQLANIGKDAGSNLTPISNQLAVNSINTTSANNMGTITDYAKWKAMADSMSKSGGTSKDIIYQLMQSGAPNDAIYRIFGVS